MPPENDNIGGGGGGGGGGIPVAGNGVFCCAILIGKGGGGGGGGGVGCAGINVEGTEVTISCLVLNEVNITCSLTVQEYIAKFSDVLSWSLDSIFGWFDVNSCPVLDNEVQTFFACLSITLFCDVLLPNSLDNDDGTKCLTFWLTSYSDLLLFVLLSKRSNVSAEAGDV